MKRQITSKNAFASSSRRNCGCWALLIVVYTLHASNDRLNLNRSGFSVSGCWLPSANKCFVSITVSRIIVQFLVNKMSRHVKHNSECLSPVKFSLPPCIASRTDSLLALNIIASTRVISYNPKLTTRNSEIGFRIHKFFILSRPHNMVLLQCTDGATLAINALWMFQYSRK